MRRFLFLLLLVITVTGSATGVHASTDCERWFIAYRNELIHTKSVQRLAAAKRRARLYAQRKLSGYINPKPANKPKLIHAVHHPRMTREEALRHLELACGLLPDTATDEPIVSEEEPAQFIAEHSLDARFDMMPVFDGDELAMNEAPPVPQFGGEYPSTDRGAAIYYPTFGGLSGGGGGGYAPPKSGGTPPGGTTPPGGGTTPPGDGGDPPGGGTALPPDAPAPPAVPEPSSYVLMLTGLACMTGVVRRSWKS